MRILDHPEHVHGTHCSLKVQSKTKIGSSEDELTVGAIRMADAILMRSGGRQQLETQGRIANAVRSIACSRVMSVLMLLLLLEQTCALYKGLVGR
jgi:hypothetical protein